MNKHTFHWAAAAIVPLALLVGACGSSGSKDASTATTAPVTTVATATTTPRTTSPHTTGNPTTTVPAKATEVTIQPLFTRGTEGGVGEEIIRYGTSDDHSLRVDFTEDEVAGLGDQSRAASWSAVTVATLLTGAPLEGRYQLRDHRPHRRPERRCAQDRRRAVAPAGRPLDQHA